MKKPARGLCAQQGRGSSLEGYLTLQIDNGHILAQVAPNGLTGKTSSRLALSSDADVMWLAVAHLAEKQLVLLACGESRAALPWEPSLYPACRRASRGSLASAA